MSQSPHVVRKQNQVSAYDRNSDIVEAKPILLIKESGQLPNDCSGCPGALQQNKASNQAKLTKIKQY